MELNKILIIRLSSIGDIVLSTPLVRAIRKKYPSAIIDFAIKKEYAILMQHNPHINKLIIVDSKNMQDSKEQVKKNKYDWIIDIQKSSRGSQLSTDGLLSVHARITTYTKQRFTRFFLIKFKWNFYKEIKPVYKRYFEAVEKFDIKDDGEGTEIFFTNKEEEKINQILSEYFGMTHNLSHGLITIAPGARFSNKRWIKEGFIEIAKKVQASHQASIAILGGPGEEELCQEIQKGISGKVINLAGKLNLLESAALMKKSKLVVENDSGMLHLAQSQKVPVVAIFGPTVNEFGFFPLPEKSTVIEYKINCRPCTKMGMNHCPKGHHLCMKAITADEVYNAMINYL